MRNGYASSMTQFMNGLAARSVLSEEEKQVILDLPFHPKHIEANRDFVRQGEALTHSSFVLEGMVGAFGQNKRGERQITTVFLGGDMIDLYTVVLPEAMADMQALTTSTVLQVPHTSLRGAAGKHPGIAEAFWRNCVIHASILNEWVMNVGRRDARSRLSHLICEIACRSGRSSNMDGYSFPFPITQNQLADMLGLTPVHVNRTLKGLREDRLIELDHRTLKILNWSRLSQVGEFDPAYLRLTGAHAACGIKGQSPPSQRVQ